jgi:multidrug efflux pump subunit AcrB
VRGAIDWFVHNKVAGNLLMLFILAGGILTIIGLKLEIFPDVSPNIVNVSVVYPGATPEEIEEGVCIKVEEAIRGLEGIKKVTSSSSENAGIVSAEIEQDADLQEVLDEIKSRVDAISTFPVDAEKPVVVEAKPPKIVLSVVVSGKTDERTLKSLAQEVRDELAALPEISRVDIANARPYEISIEVSEDALSRYGLSFDDVAGAVRQGSLNLSGGTVKTRAGEIILRSDTQAYVGREFEDISSCGRRTARASRSGTWRRSSTASRTSTSSRSSTAIRRSRSPSSASASSPRRTWRRR